MLREMREMGRLIAAFAGSAVASLAVMFGGVQLTTSPPERRPQPPAITESPYFRTLVSDSQRYREENLSLKCRLADTATERDAMRRELMRTGGMGPMGGAEVVPADRIPPQELPVLPVPKE